MPTEGPDVRLPAAIDVHAPARMVHQHVFLQRGHLAIGMKLGAAVAPLGRTRLDLDQREGRRHRRLRAIRLGGTGDRDVGKEGVPGLLRHQPGVGHVAPTSRAAQVSVDGERQVHRDPNVPQDGAGHCEDATADELVPQFLVRIPGDELVQRQPWFLSVESVEDA
ncbi:conserved hypothetical protein [Ricinus communis]|uniref:Uncharacterized protein n=1 Tax=Ricinus communis TaxID=3988 RepID=B9TD50_RICCO|nr:conserved hypothetical protein [Ricinus communis]